ncbi:MAG: aminoglycoside phosphotransferase family protein [Burkholderiales bacterium]
MTLPASIRFTQVQRWVEKQLPATAYQLAPASADASFRRYFRVTLGDGSGKTFIVMDAPPEHEDCRPFIHVAALFAQAGVHVPVVIAQDLEQGFLLLSDLGSTTYLSALDGASAASANALYRDAIDALVRIQATTRPGALPAYDRTLLERELRLFPDWYLSKQHAYALTPEQQAVLDQSFEKILANALAQPAVFVHRDYHSRNLMVCDDNPGILDFQDAVAGPITYDLVSLLRDAYIEWDEEHQLDWCIRYWEKARNARLPVADDFAVFYRDFEWMGVQRQLKVLGIFARLSHRDGKAQYLNDQPLVMRYLRAACRRYIDLAPLAKLLDALAGETPRKGYTF